MWQVGVSIKTLLLGSEWVTPTTKCRGRTSSFLVWRFIQNKTRWLWVSFQWQTHSICTLKDLDLLSQVSSLSYGRTLVSRHLRRCKSENESGIFPPRREGGPSSARVLSGNCGLLKATQLIPQNSAQKLRNVKIGLHLAKRQKEWRKMVKSWQRKMANNIIRYWKWMRIPFNTA